MGKGDEEAPNTPGKTPKRAPSSGKLLVGDLGWMGPFNRMVWSYPNSLLYILLILGAVAFFTLKAQNLSTNAVSLLVFAASREKKRKEKKSACDRTRTSSLCLSPPRARPPFVLHACMRRRRNSLFCMHASSPPWNHSATAPSSTQPSLNSLFSQPSPPPHFPPFQQLSLRHV